MVTAAESGVNIEMPRYTSHKTVWALKIASIVNVGTDTTTDEGEIIEVHFVDARYASRRINIGHKPVPEAGWYLVQYADGYISFSPAKQFEEGNSPAQAPADNPQSTTTRLLSFGAALEALKKGLKVSRTGWNGKGSFIYLVPVNSYKAQTGAAKSFFGEDALVPYRPYLALKTAQGDVEPCAVSCSDALAEDWEIVE
jgi:hypothetical protein